ncbi:MAG: TIR domain-containing protein [Opitutus sp.]|nr:TIR domain-containing protein [Opitutus sp.]
MSESTKAVFLSYASQDVAAALRICATLRAAGVEVWFDQDALVGGDAWDQKIRGQVSACALFVPVISANTQARKEGYFRLEWHLAEQRSLLIAKGEPFIVPVTIDATSERGAVVPEAFLAVQWTRLPGGETNAAFVARVQKLLGGPSAPVATSAPGSAQSSAPAQAVGSGLPRWVGVALGVVVLALIGYVVTRPGAKDATTAPKSVAETKTLPVAVPAPVPLPADKSIAVLPFENMSDDKENTAFFADGMHEDILTHLANIGDLRVISRTSVMDYRGTKKKIPEIARELGVTYILEGSVRRAGSTVRITGQLIRAANDEHLWAKSYDRELTPKEVFSIQAALATEIAGALKAAISPETKKLLDRLPTENLAAYDLYLKARPMIRGTPSGQNKREPLLLAAVGLDPTFAAAWAELAVNQGFVFRDQERTPARLAQADAALARAVRLAPDAPETRLAHGYLAYLGRRDWARATAEFEKIVRLQPNHADAIFGLATIQKRQGRWLESVANHRKALQLDPGSTFIAVDLGLVLAAGRRWNEALAAHQRWVAMGSEKSGPELLPGRAFVVRRSFSATGSTKAVDDWLAGLTPAQPESSSVISLRTWRASVRSDYPEWQRLDQLTATSTDDDDGILRPRQTADVIAKALIIAAHGDLAGARHRLGNLPADGRSKLEREPTNDTLWNEQALMEALLGHKTEALRAARKAMELMPESLDAWSGIRHGRTLAIVFAWTGDEDRAFAKLTRLLRVPVGYEGSVHDLRVDAAFAPLRGDPRFEALLIDPKNNAPLF